MNLEPNTKTSYFILIGLIISSCLIVVEMASFYSQIIDELEVPDLKLCELVDVDCGIYEPVYPIKRLPGGGGSIKKGVASWYSYTLPSGWSSHDALVAAARDWPRGSILTVQSVETGRIVTVKVTDYGPEEAVHPDRIIDLSPRAFAELAPLSQGVAPVFVRRWD